MMVRNEVVPKVSFWCRLNATVLSYPSIIAGPGRHAKSLENALLAGSSHVIL